MHTFNRPLKRALLLIGTALALQACQTTGSSNVDTAHAMDSSTYAMTAEALTSGSVRVYGFDDPVAAPTFTDSNAAYGGMTQGQMMSSDPNVMVFSLDGGPGLYDGGIPPMMPPVEGAPYRSPFPAGADTGTVNLRPPGGDGFVPMTGARGYEDSVSVYSGAATGGDNVARIYFGHGSSNVNNAGKQVIRSVAQRQQQYNPAGLIAVEAHASTRAQVSDPVERRILNLKMSMDRAFKVSSDLIRSGVPATAIRTTAYGDARPAAAMPGIDAEAASRRVEILTAP